MIPLKLELKNFLSYGSDIQKIDFSDYSLICLSGKNGNGKSAILDAITWVLWGQARKMSGNVKPDEGLMHLGKTKMMVCLEFEFSDSVYRVRREYLKTYGKPMLSLDLEVFSKSRKKFRPLTDKTVKLTQEKIERMLGLDYLTFINSAFLRQGQSDEFSKKSPKDRKCILSNILGFSRYDRFQSISLEKSRTLSNEMKILLRMQDLDSEKLAFEDNVVQELKNHKDELLILDKRIFGIEKEIKKRNDQKNALTGKKEKFDFFQAELNDLRNDYALLKTDFEKDVSVWKKNHYKSLKLACFEELEKKKLTLEKKEKEFLEEQKQTLTLKGQILEKRELFQKISSKLKAEQEKKLMEISMSVERKNVELNQIKRNISKIEGDKLVFKKKLETNKSELLGIGKELKEESKFAGLFERTKKQFEKRKAFYQVFVQRGNWISSEFKKIDKKRGAILAQDNPSCPFCEQILTARRKIFLSNKVGKEVDILNRKLKKISYLISRLKAILLEQHKEMEVFLKKEEFFRQLKNRKFELEKALKTAVDESELMAKEISSLKVEEKNIFTGLEKYKNLLDLKKREFAKKGLQFTADSKISSEIKELEKKLGLVKYNQDKHIKTQKLINDLELKLNEVVALKEKQKAQEVLRKRITSYILEMRPLKKKISKLIEAIKNLGFDVAKENLISKEMEEYQKEFNEITTKKGLLLNKIGLCEFQLKSFVALKKSINKRKEELEKIKLAITDYQFLAESFGKNGLQALLIEQSIPQIEEEANLILSKLTDNQSQIFMESLRDLKKGGVKETLDIKISDSAGVRPYEMFSGGEAFRVDFALRIAISKLLARRSGVALQTLIIDEGFGSQDEEGLLRLRDAIYSIKSDFSKVLVVSHLTTFKDNFPVHFVVEKKALGSVVTVEERG